MNSYVLGVNKFRLHMTFYFKIRIIKISANFSTFNSVFVILECTRQHHSTSLLIKKNRKHTSKNTHSFFKKNLHIANKHFRMDKIRTELNFASSSSSYSSSFVSISLSKNNEKEAPRFESSSS